MKKFFFSLLLLPFLAQAQTKGFTVKGTIAGLADGPVKIASSQDTNMVVAKGMISKGGFVLNGAVPEPGLYFLMLPREQPLYVYMENSAITVNGTKKDIKNIKIEGSRSHNDFREFQSTFTPFFGELNLLAAEINRISDAGKKALFMARFDSVVSVVNKQVAQFIGAKKSSYVSPFLLYVVSSLNTNNPAILDQHYNLLSDEVKNSNIGKALGEMISSSKVGAIGSAAMDFSQADTSGNAITLSSFKGKYVLIDFWASWCRPCRLENPNVVKAFNKFKDKNFTILGVSLDQEKEAWVKAIAKDKLTWTQVSDLQFWNNAAAQLYKVQSIPQNFLIDPQGNIVAKDLRGEDLEKKLCELLGCN